VSVRVRSGAVLFFWRTHRENPAAHKPKNRATAAGRRDVPRKSSGMEGTNEDPDVLTVAEVAKLLRLGRNAVYDACGRNQIPHRRIGKRIRFSRAMIMKWLDGDHGGVRSSSSWSSQVAKEGT
jgi:excisionase family DNA binding protein